MADKGRAGKVLQGFLDLVTSVGTTPFLVFGTALLLLGVGLVSSIFPRFTPADVGLKILVVLALGECMIVLQRLFTSIQRIESAATDATNVAIPPESKDQELKDVIQNIDQGTLWLICYGSNQFGQVLTHIEKKSGLKTQVVVCDPELALSELDSKNISATLALSRESHISVTPSQISPTIRASLVQDSRGRSVWASLAPYLLHPTPPHMRGDGSPVLWSRTPGSPLMNNLEAFIQLEHERLAGTTVGSRLPRQPILRQFGNAWGDWLDAFGNTCIDEILISAYTSTTFLSFLSETAIHVRSLRVLLLLHPETPNICAADPDSVNAQATARKWENLRTAGKVERLQVAQVPCDTFWYFGLAHTPAAGRVLCGLLSPAGNAPPETPRSLSTGEAATFSRTDAPDVYRTLVDWHGAMWRIAVPLVPGTRLQR